VILKKLDLESFTDDTDQYIQKFQKVNQNFDLERCDAIVGSDPDFIRKTMDVISGHSCGK
jgi:hypothetical protein